MKIKPKYPINSNELEEEIIIYEPPISEKPNEIYIIGIDPYEN